MEATDTMVLTPAGAHGATRPARARVLGLLVVAAVSFAFQLFLHGYSGGDRATTPDTSAYIDVAAQFEDAIQGEGLLYGDELRTPGYPLFLLFAAWTAGVDIAEMDVPTRDWESTNEQGRMFVSRVILYQQILGFSIPLLLYGIVLALGGSVPLAGVVSLAYLVDLRSVAMQYVLLNETLSLVLMLAIVLAFVQAVRKHSVGWFMACGVVAGWLLIVRPPLGILVAVLCGAAAVSLYRQRVSIGRTLRWLTLFIGVAAVLPLAWATVNYYGTGHFFYTKNSAITLQNFAARHFVELEIDDPDLLVLQKHAAQRLEESRASGVRDFETYAFTLSFDAVAEELGIDDRMQLYDLAERANRMAIVNYPWVFARDSAKRWARAWFARFVNVKNPYVLERFSDLGPLGKLMAMNGWMILGPITLFVLLLLGRHAIRRVPVQARVEIMALAAFTVVYSLIVAAADENEPDRHAMQIRIIINAMLIAAGAILAWPRLRRLKIVRRFASEQAHPTKPPVV